MGYADGVCWIDANVTMHSSLQSSWLRYVMACLMPIYISCVFVRCMYEGQAFQI